TNIDWQHRKQAQANLRRLLKRILRERGYPPDGLPRAVELVLEQAKQLGINIVEGGSGAGAENTPWGDAPVLQPSERAKVLPYPIAVFDGLVASQEGAALRVKTRIDGIERALAFLVAAELATLREASEG